ncbi:MAG: ankyrin repeat domain-containing protein [Bacteroidota bacterium]
MRQRFRTYFDRRKVRKAVGSFDEMGLITAVQRMDREALTTLLEHGLSPDACDASGIPALHHAVDNGNVPILQLLLERGAQAGLVDPSGKTALHKSIIGSRKHCFQLLLDAGSPIDSVDADACAPIHLAAAAQHASFVRELLQHGADPNLADQQGNTALMIAVRSKRTAVVKVLLEHGADPLHRNLAGQSVQEEAAHSPRIEELVEAAQRSHQVPMLEKTGALFSGLLDGLMEQVEDEDSMSRLEQKGRDMIRKLVSEDQLVDLMAKIESHPLQQDLVWVLNVLVEIRQSIRLAHSLSQHAKLDEVEARKDWQKRIYWTILEVNRRLEQENEDAFSPTQPPTQA